MLDNDNFDEKNLDGVGNSVREIHNMFENLSDENNLDDIENGKL